MRLGCVRDFCEVNWVGDEINWYVKFNVDVGGLEILEVEVGLLLVEFGGMDNN